MALSSMVGSTNTYRIIQIIPLVTYYDRDDTKYWYGGLQDPGVIAMTFEIEH